MTPKNVHDELLVRPGARVSFFRFVVFQSMVAEAFKSDGCLKRMDPIYVCALGALFYLPFFIFFILRDKKENA